jgi:hypothetical protein
MLFIRTQGDPKKLSTSLATQERLFRLLGTISSCELEFVIIDASREPSPVQYSTWGHFLEVLFALRPSRERLSVVVDPYERFTAETFKKGEILGRFLGYGNKGK